MLLGIPSGSRSSFAYGGVTLCADAFQASSATQTISYFLPDQQLWLAGPTTPITQRLPAMTRDRFGLFPFRSPLLRESRLLSLPVGTEMFHFPTFPPHALCVQAWVTGHDSCRVSPFGHPRITARLAAPRGLSQPPTSFFGSWCLGIHRAPLLTWPQRCSRPLCSSQGTGGPGRRLVARAVQAGLATPSDERPVLTVRAPCARRATVAQTIRGQRQPLPQDPTACLRRRPNSSIRSTPGRALGPPGSYSDGECVHRRTGQRSTHEHHAGMHIRPWLWTALRLPGAP